MAYRTIKPVLVDDAVAVAANFTGNPFSIEGYDRCSYEIIITGTLTGSVTVEASNDFVPNQPQPFPIYSLNPQINPANWYMLPLGLTPPAGAGYTYLIDFTQTGIPWLRTNFVWVSGAGTITTVITAKEF